MKHYLKHEGNYGTVSYLFYDAEKGASISVDKWSISFETDLDDVEWHISYDLKNGYKFITREEFEAYYIESVNKLNELSKNI